MKKKDPALWAACRIHRILGGAHNTMKADSFPPLSRLIFEQQSLERRWRLFDKAQDGAGRMPPRFCGRGCFR